MVSGRLALFVGLGGFLLGIGATVAGAVIPPIALQARTGDCALVQIENWWAGDEESRQARERRPAPISLPGRGNPIILPYGSRVAVDGQGSYRVIGVIVQIVAPRGDSEPISEDEPHEICLQR